MGYTHYWELKPATLPTEAVRVLDEVLSAAHARGVVQYEFDNPQPPLVSDTEIRFNGVGEQGHETFYFLTTGDDAEGRDWAFQFCKTARKPYDEVVMRHQNHRRRTARTGSWVSMCSLLHPAHLIERWAGTRESIYAILNQPYEQ